MIFTSESVSAGHPDKVCDQISDAILDAALEQDQNSRVAVETLVKDNQVVLAGEITMKEGSFIDYDDVVRKTILGIGGLSFIIECNKTAIEKSGTCFVDKSGEYLYVPINGEFEIIKEIL